jgi:sulfate permease, SulP family
MTEPAARRATGHAWPVLQWLPGYQKSWLRFDLIAGLTVCAVLVPEGMAYALLGSSRQLVVAVSSAVAIMSAATVSEIATAGSAEYTALTAALAILAGLVSIAFGVLRPDGSPSPSLTALEERLSLELAAAGGASAPTVTHGDLRRRRE